MESLDIKIIVALIAVFVSFIGLVISKEQKTSEFRQTWIDKIRDDISDFMGQLNQFSTSYLIEDTDTPENRKLFLKSHYTLDKTLHNFRPLLQF